MNTVQFDPKWLKGAAVCAGVKDIRYYLNGVLVDVRERETRIVATDGHRLVCFRRELPENEPAQVPAQLIIPGDVVKALKPNKAGNECVLQWETTEANEQHCKLIGLAGPDLSFTALDGKFPDYERVLIRTAPTLAHAHFNGRYVADMSKAVQVAFDQNFNAEIWPSSTSAAAVTCPRQEFYGTIMPMRGSEEFTLPAWMGEIQQPLKAVA